MVDADQALAARAHQPLRVEEFFGRGLVSDEGVARDVAKAVDRLGPRLTAAEQPAALRGRALARVREHLLKACAPKSDGPAPFARPRARPSLRSSTRRRR